MEQVVVMAMQTCSEYAQKSAVVMLTEYEMLMYEQLCRTVTAYMRKCEDNLCGREGEDDGEAASAPA